MLNWYLADFLYVMICIDIQQVLGVRPLFKGSTQEEVLKEIEEFLHNMDEWKQK
jgi:hypothetical protein